jgi:hypothetical protein
MENGQNGNGKQAAVYGIGRRWVWFQTEIDEITTLMTMTIDKCFSLRSQFGADVKSVENFYTTFSVVASAAMGLRCHPARILV